MSHLHFNFFENIHGIHGQQQVGKREHTGNSIEELPCWKFSVGRKNSAKLLYYSQAHDCKFPFPSSPPHDFFTTHLKKYLPEYDVLSFSLNSLRCASILIAFPFPEFGFLWIAGKLSPFCSKDRSFFPQGTVYICSKINLVILIQLEATWAKFRES